MRISRLWLQTFFDTELPSTAELSDALTFHAFEIDGVETVGNDDVLDVKITPNRGHDCLSYRGVAKELAAILNIPFAHDPFASNTLRSEGMTWPSGPERPSVESVAVELNSPLCKRYIAGYIKSVKVGPSPAWLQQRLEAMGQRSVNNVVDATNFVMFNLGQPLHAFDASKLIAKQGSTSLASSEVEPCFNVAVRTARAGEKMLALDEKEYALNESMLVIADANANTAIGIAGVKGGMPAAITEDTKDIVIESANFDSVSVRKTAAVLKLRTDASQRFEQDLSPELAGYGMQAVVELIQKLAGGEIVSFVDTYPQPQQQKTVSVSVDKINNTLGTQLTGADVADVFTRLQFGYKEEGGVFEIVVPLERLDLGISEDLVEEVARIIGYDKIPTTELPVISRAPDVNAYFYAAEHVRNDLISKGYSEVFTSVFTDKGERAVQNKVGGDKPYLRNTLVDGLAEALKKNIPNKDLLGLKEIKLFEIGTVWKNGKEIVVVGIASEKSKASEKPLAEYMSATEVSAYENLPVSTATRFTQFSKYPYMVRDIAMWVSDGIDSGHVLALIKKEGGELLVHSELVDDTYKKDNRTSLLFRLVFQSFERTLTEVDVNAIMEKIYATVREQGFEIR